MKELTQREMGIHLADLVGQVLRFPLDLSTTMEMADRCGYSRFHLTRVFQELTGEPLAAFRRRIRLERAAVKLLARSSVSEAAEAAGFESPESFCRAFRRAFGAGPREFAQSSQSWKIESPQNLHFNPEWDGIEQNRTLPARFPTAIGHRAETRLAVVDFVGNYANLDRAWEHVPALPGRAWYTVYLDNLWTCPRKDMMRAKLGYVSRESRLPAGFTEFLLPGGLFVATTRSVEREERNDAWSYVSGRWPDHTWGWDEYDRFPVPFEQARTRICVTAC